MKNVASTYDAMIASPSISTFSCLSCEKLEKKEKIGNWDGKLLGLLELEET